MPKPKYSFKKFRIGITLIGCAAVGVFLFGFARPAYAGNVVLTLNPPPVPAGVGYPGQMNITMDASLASQTPAAIGFEITIDNSALQAFSISPGAALNGSSKTAGCVTVSSSVYNCQISGDDADPIPTSSPIVLKGIYAVLSGVTATSSPILISNVTATGTSPSYSSLPAAGVSGTAVIAQPSNSPALSLSAGAALAGSSTPLNVSLDTSHEATSTAAQQWDMLFDPGIITNASSTNGAASIAAGKDTTCNMVVPGDYRCIVAGLNQNIIDSGVLSTITFAVSSSTQATSVPITFSGMLGTDPLGSYCHRGFWYGE